MRSTVFEGNTWTVYEELRLRDKKLHKALCGTLKEMLRSRPQKRHRKARTFKKQPRRLSQKDRVVYKFDNKYIYIFAIGGDYDRIRQP